MKCADCNSSLITRIEKFGAFIACSRCQVYHYTTSLTQTYKREQWIMERKQGLKIKVEKEKDITK